MNAVRDVAGWPDQPAEIVFEEGIIGVPRARRFELCQRDGSPVRLLRCLDIAGFVLPVVDPRLAWPGYEPDVSRVGAALGLEASEPAVLLAVTTLEPDGPTANLRAPIVINPRSCLGAQVILDDRSLPLRAKVGARP